MRPDRDQWAMQLAQVTTQRTTCLRRAVGCVLLNARGHVLSTGSNGVAAGQPHCNEPTDKIWVSGPTGEEAQILYGHACPGACAVSGTNLDGCEAIHAEQNALLQCHDVYAIDTCCTTTSPCMTCTKLLLNTSCQRIVFLEEYPHEAAQKLWLSSGRLWVKLIEPYSKEEPQC